MYKSSADSDENDQLYNELKPAVEGANYISKHMHEKNDYNEVSASYLSGGKCDCVGDCDHNSDFFFFWLCRLHRRCAPDSSGML